MSFLLFGSLKYSFNSSEFSVALLRIVYMLRERAYVGYVDVRARCRMMPVAYVNFKKLVHPGQIKGQHVLVGKSDGAAKNLLLGLLILFFILFASSG